MTKTTIKASCEIEKQLFKSILDNTLEYIWNLNLIDLCNKNEFTFILKCGHLHKRHKYKNPTKLAAREVRYNSDLYLDAIARIQAAYGIKSLLPVGKQTIPIWLASFLIFKLNLSKGFSE